VTFAAAALLVAALGTAGAAQPTVAPDFDKDVADAVLVIATSRPGEGLPAPECDAPDVICMRYPHWFRIDVLQPVYGQPPARKAFVTTWSHYGQPQPDTVEAPRLLLLWTHHGDALMPAYSAARALRRDDGEYFVPIDSANPIWWLPCEAALLREEIDAQRFPPEVQREADDHAVREHPELVLGRDEHVVPKYGIPVRRLGEWLANRRPTAAEFSCEEEETAPVSSE
jgi:hypothetical protein